jgi:hypothetical protein
LRVTMGNGYAGTAPTMLDWGGSFADKRAPEERSVLSSADGDGPLVRSSRDPRRQGFVQ